MYGDVKIFLCFGDKIILIWNLVKLVDKFWGFLWKSFFFILINNSRLLNIMFLDNLEFFLYFL